MAFDSKPMDITFVPLNIDKLSKLVLFNAYAQGQFPLGVACDTPHTHTRTYTNNVL